MTTINQQIEIFNTEREITKKTNANSGVEKYTMRIRKFDWRTQ